MECFICQKMESLMPICCPPGSRVCALCVLSGIVTSDFQCEVCDRNLTQYQCLELAKRAQFSQRIPFQRKRQQDQRGQNVCYQQNMKKSIHRNQARFHGQRGEEIHQNYQNPSFRNQQVNMPNFYPIHNMQFHNFQQTWPEFNPHMQFPNPHNFPISRVNENENQNRQFMNRQGFNQEQSQQYNFAELKNYSQTSIYPYNELTDQERTPGASNNFYDGQTSSRAEIKSKTTDGLEQQAILRNRSNLKMNRSNSLNSFALKR